MSTPPTPDELEATLFNLIWGGLPWEDLCLKYEEEIGSLVDEITERSFEVVLPRHGLSRIEVFRGGIVLMRAANGKGSVFETQARVEERLHLSRCAEFARGRWMKDVPKERGFWPVRAADGKMGVHEFRYQHGRLVDVNSGYVPAGKVTNWGGEFWSVCLMTLPGSY